MARFPYYKSNVAALGELLAKARLDPAVRERLQKDPNKTLSDLGLPTQVTSLMTFKVLDGAQDKVTVLPYRLNDAKLEAGDKTYLAGVTRLFTNESLPKNH